MRKKLLLKGPKWRRVISKRNSECSMPLEDLDWTNWWPDGFYCGQIYLHVQHKHHDTKGHDWEGTVHRVYCREGNQNRIAMKNGELYWLIDD